MSDFGPGRMSAPAYGACVALLTALGLGVAAWAHPAFLHSSLQTMGLEAVPKAAPGSFYVARIAPLLDTRCLGCHDETRAKGQLRLDSFAALMRGGKDGAVIVPGNPKASELFHRIGLPVSDDKAMPPSGKAPLTADEITVIKLWIAAGASGEVRTIKGAPRPVLEIKIPESDPALVQRQRAPLAAAVKQLQARYPGLVDYESRDSADLEVDASLKGAAFGDADLVSLTPLKARIVRADFSGTSITDASVPALAAMTSLERLRLAHTKVTDKTVEALSGIKSLKSLSVVDTKVSDAALARPRQRGVAVYGGGDGQ
jgi:Planctomycete cytochrome C